MSKLAGLYSEHVSPEFVDRLRIAFDAIQQPRTEFQLRHFVVGQHETAGQQWAQCVLEIQNKLSTLALAAIDRKIAETKIANLKRRNTEIANLKAAKLGIELQQLAWAETGARRELAALIKIMDSFGRDWSRDQLDTEQSDYWRRRLARQASQDLTATGRIGIGNQDAMRMIGLAVPGQPTYVGAVEQRFLEVGRVRILVAVPTLIPRETIKEHGLKCLEGWTVPEFIERRFYVVHGKPIADAYADAALTAINDGCTHLLCVEDDHLIAQGVFERLWQLHQQTGPRSIVGAWYPRKADGRSGAPIVVRNGSRSYLAADGEVHEVYTIPQGFTLIPTTIFNEIPQPWFATTGCITQDSFFSQLARENGYRLLVDTAARIQHVCRHTGHVYE
jgi:hypothetical protein